MVDLLRGGVLVGVVVILADRLVSALVVVVALVSVAGGVLCLSFFDLLGEGFDALSPLVRVLLLLVSFLVVVVLVVFGVCTAFAGRLFPCACACCSRFLAVVLTVATTFFSSLLSAFISALYKSWPDPRRPIRSRTSWSNSALACVALKAASATVPSLVPYS